MAHWDSIGFVNEENVETISDKKLECFYIKRRRRSSADAQWNVYRVIYNDCAQAYDAAKLALKDYKECANLFEYEWKLVRVYVKPKPKKLTYQDRLSFVKFALQELDRLDKDRLPADYEFRAKYILATLGFKEKV